MKNLASCICMLGVILMAISTLTFGADSYVITNDGNLLGNSSTVYGLNAATGTLTKLGVLKTGGGGCCFSPGNPANIAQAITNNAGCVFVFDAGVDTGFSDIASFSKTTGYGLVGSFSDASLSAIADGGSLALTPNGKFLYASYSSSNNIGAWKVGSDCSLSLIGIYAPKMFAAGAALGVTPNGANIVSSPGSVPVADLLSINQADGTLTDLGYLSFNGFQPCLKFGCYPAGIDFTRDSRLAIFADATGLPLVITARITRTGLTQPSVWYLKNGLGLGRTVAPFLDAAGYEGSGTLYLSTVGGGLYNPNAGIIVAKFIESPLAITFVGGYITAQGQETNGAIASVGNLIVIATEPDLITVLRVGSDGSLEALGSTIDEQASDLFSFSVFPSSR